MSRLLRIALCQALPTYDRRHPVLMSILPDDYQELLVQRVAAVAASSGIIRGGFIELAYPRFSSVFAAPCPAKLFELLGQFPARIGVNAVRRGKRDLYKGEAAVAAKAGIAAVADVDDILAGDLRHLADPSVSAILHLVIGLGRLLRHGALGLIRVTASNELGFVKRLVDHRATRCVALAQAGSDKPSD